MTIDHRRRCPICGRSVSVRKDGALSIHGYDPADRTKPACVGSGPPTRSDLLKRTPPVRYVRRTA